MRYAFLVHRPGKPAVLAWTLDMAEELAGGELWSDHREPGRYATVDGSVTVETYRVDWLRGAPEVVAA